MKKLVAIFLTLVFMHLSFGPAFSAVKSISTDVKLPTNTRIKLSTMDNISSDINSAGEEISLQVAENIAVNNKIVIPAGTVAVGNIVSLDKRSFLEKGGRISVELLYTTAVDGTRVPLRGTYTTAGASKIGKMLALSLIITPLFLLMRGDHAVMAAGTKINGYIDQDCNIDLNNKL